MLIRASHGAANNLSPDGVVKAAGLVTEGRTYPLGIVVSRDTPAFPPRFVSVTVLTPGQAAGVSIGKGDVVTLHTGWLSLIGEDNQRFVSKEPGIGVEAAT